MSKMVGSCPEFEKKCTSIAEEVLSVWANTVYCHYDGSAFSKRDFILRAHHSWGSAYCHWGYDTKHELFEKLKAAGATNIIGYVKWNWVDIAFDIKKSVLKQYRKEEGNEKED